MVNAGELLIIWLVFWNMNFIFSIQLGIIILTDELIFFRGVGQPPTRKFRAGKIIELIGGLMVINDDD